MLHWRKEIGVISKTPLAFPRLCRWTAWY